MKMNALNDIKLPNDLSDVCRTCLSSNGEKTSIFNIGNESRIDFMLIDISHLQILSGDGLPSKICDLCVIQTNQAFTFIQQIKSADKILKKHCDDLASIDEDCGHSIDNLDIYNDNVDLNIDDDIDQIKLSKFEICPMCSEKFDTQYLYLKHVKEIHNINKPYNCDHCQASYAIKKSLEVHIKDKHICERKFDCKICSKIFLDKKRYNRHQKTHESPFTCEICEKSFGFRQSLNIHMQIHQKKEIHPCAECNLTFPGLYHLQRHTKVAHTGETHECAQCQKVFTHKTRLRKHLLCHMETVERRFHCQHCPKKFNYRHHLKNHERIHTGSKPFLCTKCGRSFTQSHNLTLHHRQHDNVLPYGCEICQKTFAHPHRLKRHLLTHSGEKPYMCNICGKQYSDKTTLKKHISSHKTKDDKIKAKAKLHVNKNVKSVIKNDLNAHKCVYKKEDKAKVISNQKSNKFVCNVCNRDFNLASILEKHLRMHSTKQRRCICNECGTGYTRPEHLREHMKRVHLQNRPFTCPQCPRKFFQNCELKVHIRRHTGEKPYVCPICSKAFVTSQALSTHNRTHTGEKPYKCDFCPKAFSTSSALTIHMKTHPMENTKNQTSNQSKNVILINNENNRYEMESIQSYNKLISNKVSSELMIHNDSSSTSKDELNIIIDDVVENDETIQRNSINTIRSNDGKLFLHLPENLRLEYDLKMQQQHGSLKSLDETYAMVEYGKVIKFSESDLQRIITNRDAMYNDIENIKQN